LGLGGSLQLSCSPAIVTGCFSARADMTVGEGLAADSRGFCLVLMSTSANKEGVSSPHLPPVGAELSDNSEKNLL